MSEEEAPQKEVTNEGARLLRLVLANTTQEKIAELVGCTRPNVSYWVTGKNLPGTAARKILQAKFGIHPNAWGRASGSEPRASGSSHDSVAGTSVIDLLNRRIMDWSKVCEDEDEDVNVRLKAGELERKCIAERRALERDARSRESDIVASSPEWADIRRRTLAVLADYPDAMRAWVHAMGRLAQEQAPAPLDEEEENES